MLKTQFLQKIIDYGLLSIIIIFPLTVKIALITTSDPGHPLISVNFSLADIAMGIILLLWLLKLLIYKGWKQVKLPPLPILIFAAIGILSFVNAFSISEWAKELLQLIEYFILFYLLLLNNWQTIKIETIKTFLFISTSVILFVAFVQGIILDSEPYFIRSFFLNHNILGTYLCITIPLIYVDFVFSKNLFHKLWMGILLLLSIVTISSGNVILALAIALSIISYHYGKKLFLRYVSVLAALSVLYIVFMPAKNKNAIMNFASIYEQGSVSQNYYRRLSLLNNIPLKEFYNKPLDDGKYILVTGNELGITTVHKLIGKGAYKEMEGTKQIKNNYLEMQAALNLMSDSPLLGVGLGNYQNYIGTCFKGFPKVNTAEPNQNNTYLIIGSTMGILGLSALFYILWSFLKKSFSNFKGRENNEIEKILALGLTGSMITLVIEGFFSFIFNASLIVPLIVIFFLIDHLQKNRT
jgi:hypothetical protein